MSLIVDHICAHIVGLDNISKKLLTDKLANRAYFVDLDKFQQMVHNEPNMVTLKNELANAGSNKERHDVRRKIVELWKINMSKLINKYIIKSPHPLIIFLGSNVFPKDHRHNVHIDNIIYKIFFNCSSTEFARNQIRFFLLHYSSKIENGSFSINLLDHRYLRKIFDKYISHYEKQNYRPRTFDQIIQIILSCNNGNPFNLVE